MATSFLVSWVFVTQNTCLWSFPCFLATGLISRVFCMDFTVSHLAEASCFCWKEVVLQDHSLGLRGTLCSWVGLCVLVFSTDRSKTKNFFNESTYWSCHETACLRSGSQQCCCNYLFYVIIYSRNNTNTTTNRFSLFMWTRWRVMEYISLQEDTRGKNLVIVSVCYIVEFICFIWLSLFWG